MSRTLKDRPVWVALNDPRMPTLPEHGHTLLGKEIVHFVGGMPTVGSYPDDCTIDAPVTYRTDRLGELRPCQPQNGWTTRKGPAPSARKRREKYWAPERAAKRSAIRRMAGEYNTTGDVDEDLPLTNQHRHGRFGGKRW